MTENKCIPNVGNFDQQNTEPQNVEVRYAGIFFIKNARSDAFCDIPCMNISD